jgi:hypothetical protein
MWLDDSTCPQKYERLSCTSCVLGVEETRYEASNIKEEVKKKATKLRVIKNAMLLA